MQWLNVLSQQASLEKALQELASHAEFTEADVGFLFVSSAFASEYPRILPLLHQCFRIRVLVGCSGSGVIGSGLEIEEEPAISLTLARLPDVQVHPFYLDPAAMPDLDASPAAWEAYLGISNQLRPHFILLSDHFRTGINELVQGLDFAYPHSSKVGGLMSGGSQARDHALFLQDRFYRQGTVGVALAGNIRVDSVVAQGCRPVGSPLQVSQISGNVITALEDRPPLALLKDMVQDLSPQEQRLIRHSNGIFIGIVTDPFKADPKPGDFLVRMILGLDPETGAIAVAERIRPGQRIQFHVRDAQTSAADLKTVLERYQAGLKTAPQGALLFSCLARGISLYQAPNIDSTLMASILGDIPLGGFFGNGEIGPVGNSTHVHGFTSVFALFHPAHA
ncbi:MAG: FIST N-terminal domain-containing protein [Thermostichales cyanobacterium GMQP_bins_62]